ncbi:MAG TPA: ABC transporter substrate-binding protein [Gaiellaceae bacterium]|nr:ABC transporter substrate-binding protein [Gaiellaceae bacterium]
MRRKQLLSLFMLVVGASLLVAAMSVAGASGSTNKVGHSQAAKGGTLKLNESSEDFDYVDPQIAYRTDDWAMLNTTAMLLVGFPEKSGAAGSQLYPIGATAFPTVSKDGKTYTFHIRPGMKFSDGSPVNAASYQRAFERTLSPKMGSPVGVNIGLQDEIVGADAFLNGKASSISGVKASGNTLTVKLTKANATFVSQLGMQWFTATKADTKYTSQGLQTFPSAGPYYIASRDPGRSTVLKRNPYYKGDRPANPDEIVFTPNVDPDQSLLQVKAGQSDLDIAGNVPTSSASLAQQYGVNKSRFKVGPTSCMSYMSMNNARAPFNNLSLRKAVNWAIDRPAQVRLLGAYAGKRTDQILVPGIPGYKPYNVYALKGADVAKAKSVGGAAIASAPEINFVHTTSQVSTNRAQIAEYNLRQVGFKINDVPTPATTFYQVVGARNSTYNLTSNGGWCADYFDPYDYINVIFNGRNIQANNNVFYSYFNNATFNAQMDAAANLSGTARANAYAKLDQELMVKYAPVVPYLINNDHFFTSARLKNWIYSAYFGEPYFNALTVG